VDLALWKQPARGARRDRPGGRWASGEAIRRQTIPKIKEDRARIEARRGKNIAEIAEARKRLTLVYYGLRDGHIRALHQTLNSAKVAG
jgi:hypothetical protein